MSCHDAVRERDNVYDESGNLDFVGFSVVLHSSNERYQDDLLFDIAFHLQTGHRTFELDC